MPFSRRALFGENRFFSASSNSGGAEHAIAARAGDGDAHVGRPSRDEHADQRVTRRLVAEFLVGGLLRQREHARA